MQTTCSVGRKKKHISVAVDHNSMQCKHKPQLTVYMEQVIIPVKTDGEKAGLWELCAYEDWSVNGLQSRCRRFKDKIKSSSVYVISFLVTYTHQSVTKEQILCCYIWGLTGTLEHDASL